MVDYVRIAQRTKAIVEANGRNVSIYRKSTTPGDSSKPWRGPSAPDTLVATVKGVVYPFEFKDVDGTIIRRGDVKVTIAHDSLPPGTTDLEVLDWLDDGGVYYKILGVSVIGPGGFRLCYDIHVRR